jgi:glycosyltransferase involved in cell wall biosynthesis
MSRSELVSVLMPAFKPEFLREAMSSVLRQEHGEIELLVGDNSGDPSIRAIVEEFNDPRVVHVPSHAVTGGSVKLNHLLLWWRARSRYVRFVYDDDVIYPRSTDVLLDLLQGQPASAMAWHQRDIIDASSRVLGRQNALGDVPRVVLDQPALMVNLARQMNFIGEFSFVMFDREVHKTFDFNRHAHFDTRYMWDVAMFIEAAGNGLLVGTPEFLGGFRRHGNQITTTSGTILACCLEWELIYRNALADGRLSADVALRALQHVALLYAKHRADAPQLAGFAERLVRELEAGTVAVGTAAFNAAYRELVRANPK